MVHLAAAYDCHHVVIAGGVDTDIPLDVWIGGHD